MSPAPGHEACQLLYPVQHTVEPFNCRFRWSLVIWR